MTSSHGVHTSALVEHVDLYPTLAELAGVPVNASEKIAGKSYANLFSDPSGDHKTYAFTQYPRCCKKNATCDDVVNFQNHKRCANVKKTEFSFMGYSVRTDRWRYTEWCRWDPVTLTAIFDPARPFVELYDHQGDDMGRWTYERFENVNVAHQNPDVVEQLSQVLQNYAKREAKKRLGF